MSSPRAGIPGLSRAKDEAVYDIRSVAMRYRATADELDAIAARAKRLRLHAIHDRAMDVIAQHLEVVMRP